MVGIELEVVVVAVVVVVVMVADDTKRVYRESVNVTVTIHISPFWLFLFSVYP